MWDTSSTGCRRTSRAIGSTFGTSKSTPRVGRRSSSTCFVPCGMCRTARSSRMPIWRGSPVIQAHSARPAPSARGTASPSSCRVTASSRPTVSARTGRWGSITSEGCWCSKVSLSEELRSELAGIAPRTACDRLAELSGLFHGAGSVHFRGRGEVAVHLDVADSAVARRAFRLLRRFGVASEVRTYRRRAFERATRYQLHVAGDDRALQVLHEAGALGPRLAPLAHPPRRVVARSCCRRAYLRGALLAAGSLTGPRSLHLEIRTAAAEGAAFIARLAAREGAALSVRDRGAHAAAYAKGADAIADTLAAAGASNSILGLAESAVLAATRGRANRLANADHANL